MTPLPHGGKLVYRRLDGAAAAAFKQESAKLPSLTLDAVNLSDLEMLAEGAFSPLTGFMGTADYERVLAEMRLAKGLIWPIPITLAAGREQTDLLGAGQKVALRDRRGELWGLLRVTEVFPWSPEREAKLVFGINLAAHPGVKRLFELGDRLIAGEVWALPRKLAGPWLVYYLGPAQTRAEFVRRGWRTITGFQTGDPIHRTHEYPQKIALEITDGLLLQPIIGAEKPDDIPADIRLRCYEVLLANYFPADRVFLAAMPGAMRCAGPREAVLRALVGKNYGCTHFIVGRDLAGIGDFYRPFAAREVFSYFGQGELGIQPLFFGHAFYCRVCAGMATKKTCPHEEAQRVNLNGSAVRAMLSLGKALPPEFTRPEVAALLLEMMGRQI